jgi:hypothetical protein
MKLGSIVKAAKVVGKVSGVLRYTDARNTSEKKMPARTPRLIVVALLVDLGLDIGIAEALFDLVMAVSAAR